MAWPTANNCNLRQKLNKTNIVGDTTNESVWCRPKYQLRASTIIRNVCCIKSGRVDWATRLLYRSMGRSLKKWMIVVLGEEGWAWLLKLLHLHRIICGTCDKFLRSYCSAFEFVSRNGSSGAGLVAVFVSELGISLFSWTSLSICYCLGERLVRIITVSCEMWWSPIPFVMLCCCLAVKSRSIVLDSVAVA